MVRSMTILHLCFQLLTIPIMGVVAAPSENYLDWIVKSICVVSDNQLTLPDDPYYGCPEDSIIRKIRASDVLPYNNYEQMGYQIADSLVGIDADGQNLYYHTFDYAPFNEFNQYAGSDGYDVYSLLDNVVSVSNTKDGGGYGSTFYGQDCSFGGGWTLFPQTNFLNASQNYWPISGVYWEHNEESGPGTCPSGYSTNTLTVWEFLSLHPYGGINGNPKKEIDTLVSYHGFETDDGTSPTENFLMNGHLEVFYFTELYGLTRWEVWAPVIESNDITTARTSTDTTAKLRLKNAPSQLPNTKRSAEGLSLSSSSSSFSSSLPECSGDSVRTFKGVNFTITDCHDWSNVQPVNAAATPPPWRNFTAGTTDTADHTSNRGGSSMGNTTTTTTTTTTSHVGLLWQQQTLSSLPWPLVNANLLQYHHFDAGFSEPCGGSGLWCRFGTNPAGNIINWSSDTSTGSSDGNFGTGMKYLAVNCGDGEQCGSAGSQAVYQDIDITSLHISTNESILMGVNGRVARGTLTVGTLQLKLQIVVFPAGNASVEILWEHSIDAVLPADDGTLNYDWDSVYLSSIFVYDVVTFPSTLSNLLLRQKQHGEAAATGPGTLLNQSYYIRFLILPVTPNTFYITDAFVNRYPSAE